MKNTPPKCFAALVRVSTEGQKEKGASLETQEQRIKGWVNIIGEGKSRIKWYKGQESSTEGAERKICDKLLEDSKKGLFDAVIVYDLSRWSRDTLRSINNLEYLAMSGVTRFFEGMTERDLENEEDIFVITMMSAIYSKEAKKNKSRMLDGKITRANQGWAVSSPKRIPWGRTFENDKTKYYESVYDRWGLIDGAKEKITRIVDRYLNGEKTGILANELNISTSYLLKIFKNHLGNKWERKFRLPGRKQEYKSIPIHMPPLIDNEEKINAVHKRTESNKTWSHGSYKRDYLFGSMIFCKDCGAALSGTPKKNIQYYYHENKKPMCTIKRYVPEKDLEVAVLSHLFYMYEDKQKIEEAVQRYYPNQEEHKKHIEEDASDKNELMKLQRQEDIIVAKLSTELISDAAAERALNKIKERRTLFEKNITKRIPLLENAPPTEDEIEDEIDFIRRMASIALSSPSRLSRMTFKDKRALVTMAFGDKDDRGKRLGIYVEQGSTDRSIKYTLNGKFPNHISGELPMSLEEIQNHLVIDPEYEGDYNPFDKTVTKKVKSKGDRKRVINKKGKVNSQSFNIVFPEPGGPIISTL